MPMHNFEVITSKVFCSNLIRLRKKRGLTQQDMADKLEMEWRTYVAYEYAHKNGGKPWPRPERIDDFCRILKSKPGDFFKEI